MKTPKNKNNSFDLGRFARSVTTKKTMRLPIALLASASATWCLFAMGDALIMNPSKNITVTNAPTGVPFVDIGAPAGPLTHIYIGDELSCQVAHISDPLLEFYPSGGIPGDCGTFIALDGTGGTLYAPDFSAHSGGTFTGALGARVPFTPMSQVQTGTGTGPDPLEAVTLVSLSSTALQIQQTDRYIVGEEFYRTEITIINNGGPAAGVLYRAGDAFLAGSDSGSGFTEVFGNRTAVGCSVNPNNVPPGPIEEWIPFTGPNNFYQGVFSAVWTRIGARVSFPNTCDCPTTPQDNGAGISWDFSIPAFGSATFLHLTKFICPGTIFGENFDGVNAPTLPVGWAAANAPPGGSAWVTSAITPDTAPNAAFVAAPPAAISDKRLDTPAIAITSPSVRVSFRQSVNLQSTFDGGVLEVSSPNIAGGAFTDILDSAVGGTFVTGGYNAEISPNTGSPIAGRSAWSGSSCGYFCTVANLGPNVSGQTIKLRFRMASDNSGSATSEWRVDTFQVLSSQAVCGPCVPPTLSPTKLLNISTRAMVGTGGDVLIGGFIITGDAPKRVGIRGLGPSLISFGISNALADPTLELRDCNGALVLSNDNWRDTQEAEIQAAGLAPTNDLESAMVVSLSSRASYTAILAGRNGGTGVGLVEIYDIDQAADSQLANISTRGLVLTGDEVMIGGCIVGGSSNSTRVAVRGIGVALGLADPTLELHGPPLIFNDDWQDDQVSAMELSLHNLSLPASVESGIFTVRPPGAFTVILAGKNGGTGVGLIEIYNVH